MLTILKAIKNASRDNVEYFAGLIAILYLLKDIGKLIISAYPTKVVWYLQIGSVVGFLLLLWLLIRYWKKLYRSFRYQYDITLYQNNIKENQASVIDGARLDYSKILPTTSHLNYIYEETLGLARKYFAKDSYLHKFALTIEVLPDSIFKPNNIWTIAFLTYFSPLKRYEKTFVLGNLKLPDKKDIKVEMSRNLEASVGSLESSPFFKCRAWRKAVLTAFDCIDSELMGRRFEFHVHGNKQRFYMSFQPSTPVKRHHFFTYENGELREGYDKDSRVIQIR